MQASSNFQVNHEVLDRYIQFLEQPQFDKLHARQWAQRFKADPEAAMCEASFWAVLHDCGVTVEPNPSFTPDFLCWKGGQKFYVEVTCILNDTATRKTGLAPQPESFKSSWYQPLNDTIRDECRNKTNKCANLDAPCVVAVGTFHYQASVLAVNEDLMECLHVDPCIGFDFDAGPRQFVGEPYEIAQRRKSIFTRLDGGGVTHIRGPISALLVAGFGCNPPQIFGLLNPAPAREFDPELLRRIPFCVENTDFSKAEVSLEWIQTDDVASHTRSIR